MRLRRLRSAVGDVLDEVSSWIDRLACWIDPPQPPVRPEERAAARTRHPSTGGRPSTVLGDVSPTDGPLAEVVPFPRVEVEEGWVACTLGAISATRPIGAHVRLTPPGGEQVEGRIEKLYASESSFVQYVLVVEAGPGRLALDLPLSHPLEVRRD